MQHLSLLVLAVSINLSLLPPTEALYPFKLIHNASHAIPLSPDEWAAEFQCDTSNNNRNNLELPVGNETIKSEQARECYRDKNAWIYKHVDELQGDFKFLVHQESIDARFADSVYLTNGHTGLDFHHYKFNSGDPKQDELNQQLVAGAEVDYGLCTLHLKEMVSLLEDLGASVEQMRSSNNGTATKRLDEQHFRLARVLDSFGRYESGHLGGRYHSFGLYDQCISTALMLDSISIQGNQQDDTTRPLVGSRYCWARLSLDRHLSRPLRDGSASYVTSYFTGDFKLHMAVCLPKTCHSAAFVTQFNNSNTSKQNQDNLRLVQRLIDSQFKMPSSMYLDESLPLESVFCLADDDSQVARMPLSGKLFIGFVLAWTLACIFATYKRRAKHHFMLDDLRMISSQQHVPLKQITTRSLWSHLDLFESWCEFLGEREVSRQGERVNLDPLNFIKWFCGLLVVMAHATVLSGPMTLAHIRLVAFMETNRFESLSLFGFVLIDSFFVISGMIMSYIFLKRITAYERSQTQDLEQQLPPTITTSQPFKIKRVATHHITPEQLDREFSPLGAGFHKACMMLTLTRYLRLIPLFFLVFWFKKSVYPYLGSGPMWDYGLNKDTTIGGCQQETWLTPFTFMSAYLPSAQQCLPQTWTVSNDLFFALILPPVIVLLYRWPKSAFALAAVNLASSLYLGKVLYFQLDARARFEIEQLRDHSMVIMFQIASYLYTVPLYRAPAIIVGILSGYILFKYSQCGGGSSCKGSTRDDTGDCGSAVGVIISENGGTATMVANGRRLTISPAGRWPWWFRGPLTYIALTIVAFVFTLSLFTPEFRRYASENTKRSMVVYMLLYYHLIWSLANGVLLLRLVTDLNNHFILRMFASKFFSSAGKLTYAILLTHWDLLMYDIHIETQALEFSRWNYFGSMALAYFIAVPLAIVIYVIFENPLDKLTKSFLPRV